MPSLSVQALVSAEWAARYGGVLADAGLLAEYHVGGDSLFDVLAASWTPVDLFIVDLARVSRALAPRLRGERLLAFGDPDNAAVALAAERVVFLADAPGDEALVETVRGLLVDQPTGVADLSDRSAARLGRLGGEASRIADVLARLAPAAAPPPPIDPARIRDVIRARRLRDRFFPPDLFGEPAWDMLLDLAVAAAERRDVAVSSLCIAAAVPTSTALRWIRSLCDAGLFERRDDPADARRAFIDLSAAGATAMARYLAQTA